LNIEVSGNSINHRVVSNLRSDVLLITHGNLLENCVKAAERNPRFAVYAMNKILPLDGNELGRLFSIYLNIVVVEDHLVGSGLYNTLCQYIVESRESRAKLHVIAPPNRYEDRVGDKNYFAF
jgi:transketolase C-terminal domain/subunit